MELVDSIILGLVLASFALAYLTHRTAWPVLNILNRWVRWIVFALLFGLIVANFNERTSLSFWPMVGSGFLVYLLFETMYNWLVIGALSKSDMALFPQFRANQDGDEWPAHKRYHATRQWMREQGFERKQSLKAELIDGVHLRASVYQEPTGQTRLQILFIPQRAGHLGMCYIFSSLTTSGERLITDNIFMPFGGFYPDSWLIKRKPLLRSIARLHKLHKQRVVKSNSPLCSWEDDPLHDLNAQQRELEQLNLHEGFLLPRDQHEDFGKISGEGRYRIWKEIWSLNYLGLSTSG